MPSYGEANRFSSTTLTNPIVFVGPVADPAPDRGADLQVRISAPAAGTALPVIVLAHGFGLDMNSYDPLVEFWVANGFVVIQPTFLDSLTLGLAPEDSRYPLIWRTRIDDLNRVIDQVETLVDALPGLAVRVDTKRLAVAGHSWGGQSVSMLLGARVIGENGRPGDDATNPRVKAGVLLATPGTGGDDLTPFARENLSFMSPDFDHVSSPTLVVAGDHDQSPLTTRGPDWFTDVYRQSPGAESLVTVYGGEHSLGGIHAYGSTDTTDESPERVDLIRRTTTAFLQQALGIDGTAWDRERAALADAVAPAGRIDSK